MEEESGSRNGDMSNQNDDNTQLSQDTGGSGPARSEDHGDTPLHQCVRDKSLAAMKDILASYTNKYSLKSAMISTNNDGLTPLIMAASMDWDEGVDVLLGTQVLDKEDITQLVHDGIINKQCEIPKVDELNRWEFSLKTKVLPDIVPHTPKEDQWTIFTLTAAVGWVGVLNLLLKVRQSVPMNKISGHNVLHIAIFSGVEAIPNLVLNVLDNGQKSEVVNHYRKYIYSPIFYAIEMQFCSLVERLLQYVDAKHVTSDDCYNVLHHAAAYAQPGSNGEPGIWNILLEEKSPQHIKGLFMKCYDHSLVGTPLHKAAKMGNLHSVSVLCERYSKWLTAKDKKGWTPLHWAAAKERVEIIRYIVDKDVRTLMATDHNDHTPLAIALSRNRNVDLLLDLGVLSHKFGGSSKEPNDETITTDEKYKSYSTTMCVAAKHGNLKCVRTLHEVYKVPLRITDRNGKTPLHYAVEGRDEIIHYIVEKDRKTLMDTDDNGDRPFATAIKRNAHSSTVEQILELGASRLQLDELRRALFIKNDSDDDANWMSCNPLQIAVQYGTLETVKILCDKDKDLLTTKDHKGWSALHYAAAIGKDDMIEYIVGRLRLLEYLEATDDFGHTPLAIAIINNNDSSMNLLFHHTASKIVDAYVVGRTRANSIYYHLYGPTIRLAAKYGYFECVEFLYEENNELLSNKDDKGRTPLHYAAAHGSDKVIRYIVARNSMTLKAKDNMGNTPLITAIVHKNESNVKLLLELGASLAETISKEAEESLPPAETSNVSSVPRAEKSNESTVPPAETCSESTVPPAETSNDSTVPPAETSSESTVPPAETSNESTVPPTGTSSESTVPPAETSSESTVPPAETSNESTVPSAETSNESTVPPAETSSESTVPPAETTNESTAPPAETSSESTVPPEKTSNDSTVPPAETSSESTVPPAETSNESTVPSAETSNESTVPPAETSNVSYFPPAETPNGSDIPLTELHSVSHNRPAETSSLSSVLPAETPKASLVENHRKSFFTRLFYKEGHEEKSALELILDWWKNEKLAKDLLDSCIKGNVKDDSAGSKNSSESHIQLNFEIFQSEDGRWFNFVYPLEKRQELLLHPVTESLVWQSTQNVKYQIYYNSAVHFVLLWFLYILQQYWQINERFTTFNAVCLPFLFFWVIFIYIQDLHNQARMDALFITSAIRFCSIFAAIVLTAFPLNTSPELVIALLKLLFFLEYLRIVLFFGQASLFIFLHMVGAVLKMLMIAFGAIILSMCLSMIITVPKDPMHALMALEKEVWIFVSDIYEEITFLTIGEMIAGLTAVGTFIRKMKLDVHCIKKYFEVKNKYDIGDATIWQATVLESLSRSSFFKNKKFTPSINVYHDRKFDNKYHGSSLLGNRIWECVAEWYVTQSDPEREEDKKKFMKAKGIKTKHCALHTCLCEVKSTQPIDTPTGESSSQLDNMSSNYSYI